MIYVSCRKDRLSDHFFTSRHEHVAFEITTSQITPLMADNDKNDDALGKLGKNSPTIKPASIKQMATDQHVLVLVHGYRNPFANVARAYRNVEQGMTKEGLIGGSNYGLVIGYLWPGMRLRVGFFLAVPNANQAGVDFLPDFLEELSSVAKSVDIQTHSLGARVALGALKVGGHRFGEKVDNVMLTAPAVDDEVLEKDKEFHEAALTAQRTFVYHSNNDPVVGLTYRLGDAPEFDAALGRKGTEHPDRLAAHSPNVYIVDCSEKVHKHGGYRETPEFYTHWGHVVKENQEFPQFDKL